MIPKSLSASAVACFASCPARYKAEWIEKVPSPSGSAALLGTTAHSALEDFVASGQAQDGAPVAVLKDLFDKHYWTNFTTDDRMFEGHEMMEKWHGRQDWKGVEVISTERKEGFELPTSQGAVRFNFILDRLDKLEDGTIRVVDYKSNFISMTYDQLRSLIQPQVYGMGARLKFPKAPKIWVEFDFLRHQPIGVMVDKVDNRATWEYLKTMAEAILASDGTEERICAECQYCVRRHECDTLNKHIIGGGPLSIMEDPGATAKRRMDLFNAQKAIKIMIGEIDEVLTAHLEHEGLAEFETSEVSVSLSSSRRRGVDSQMVAGLVGEDVYAKYATIGVTALEELLRKEDLSPDVIIATKDQIQWKFGKTGIKVKPKGPLDDDE